MLGKGVFDMASKNQLVLGIVFVLFLIVAVGCTQQENAKTKIGVMAPLSGGAVELGQHVQRGIDLANERLENKYRLIYEDDQCINTQLALSGAQKISTIDNVKFVIGPLCTPAYQAVAKLFNEKQISFMHTSGVANAHILTAGDYGVPGISSDQFAEMKYLADYVYNGRNIHKISLLTWNQEWALQYRLGFLKAYQELGGEIILDEQFNTEDTEYRTPVAKIAQSDADGVLVVGLNYQAADIVQQLRLVDSDIPIFGQLDNDDPSFLAAVGASGDGMQWPLPKLDFENEETAWFLQTYRERFGVEPNYYAFIGYDSLKLFDYAINECNGDSKCVTQTMLAIQNFPGISGKINFNDKFVVRDFGIREIKNGTIVSVKQ